MSIRVYWILLAGLFLIAGATAYAQKNVSRPLLENLLKNSKPIAEIASYNYLLDQVYDIPDPELPYMKGIHQFLVRNNQGLFLLVDGTGRVYKVERIDQEIHFLRIDSTKFYGYNFGFGTFSHRDSLYSFGGYGYWRFNGLLRVFIEQTGDWSVLKLNREVPFGKPTVAFVPLFLYDGRAEKVFLGYSMNNLEGIANSSSHLRSDTVHELDLKTRRWSVLGALGTGVIELAANANNLGATPWGQLIHSYKDDKFYLLDYRGNEVLTLGQSKAVNVARLVSAACVSFFRDSSLFIYNLHTGRLDSLDIGRDDFTSTKSPLYTPFSILRTSHHLKTGDNNALLLLEISVVLLGGYIAWRELTIRRRQKKSVIPYQKEALAPSSEMFTELEKETMRLMYSNSRKGRSTSIQEMNELLGVVHKSVEVQKKHRSDTIISINRKSRYITKNNDLLVTKKRSEKDKRTFEYFIEFDKLKEWKIVGE